MDYVVAPKILIGRHGELAVGPHTISTPTIVDVKGHNLYLNIAFAMACVDFPNDMLLELGFDVRTVTNFLFFDKSLRHYIGPHFRWEISGFCSSVIEEISIGLPSTDSEHLVQVLKALAIDDLIQRDPSKLSGGETAKVVIASRLVHRPKYLILDRVLGELDGLSRHSLLSNIKSLLPYSIIFVVDETVVTETDTTAFISSNEVIWKCGAITVNDSTPFMRTYSQISLKIISIHSFCSEPKIIIDNFCAFRAGEKVTGPLDCAAAPGDLVLLTGDNGSGKTSFMEGLAGLLEVEGKVTVAGADIKLSSDILFAFSPQDPQCDITELNIYSELKLACDNDNKVFAFVEELGIPSGILMETMNDDISLQKCASVLACIMRGKTICLLDEPTLYLGQELRGLVMKAISHYLAGGGIVFCSSHDREFMFCLTVHNSGPAISV